MGLKRIRGMLLLALCGGMVLQTTASCQDTLVPALTNLAVSVALEMLMGGLAT